MKTPIKITQNPFEFESLKIIFEERLKNKLITNNLPINQHVFTHYWNEYIKQIQMFRFEKYEELLQFAKDNVDITIDDSIEELKENF